MSTVNAAAHKTFGRGFSNERQFVKLTYDFANDAERQLMQSDSGTTNGKILVMDSVVHVRNSLYI